MPWIKTLGLAMLFLVCGGTGAAMARAMVLRCRELERCLQLLAGLRAQLQFTRPPLQAMLQAQATATAPTFLPACLHLLGAGLAFPQAWQQALQASPAMHSQDKPLLLPLAEVLGASDAEGQCEHLLLHTQLLEAQLQRARHQRDTQGKAVYLLGVLAGLTLLIVLA